MGGTYYLKRNMPQMKSDLLKAERIKHGWTQAKVAEAVGVDAKTVGRWERGKALPYPYYREQLCSSLWQDGSAVRLVL
jgi:transcriptional regulator with XRE-family HTH domain